MVFVASIFTDLSSYLLIFVCGGESIVILISIFQN